MDSPVAASLAELILRGYRAQCSDRLEEAERCYRAALSLNPATFDALHMLGVVRLQRGDAEEAVRLLLAALPLLQDDHPPIYRNLGLCLAAVALNRDLVGAAASDGRGRAHEGFFRATALPALPAELPLVSIVLPCCSEHGSPAAAIASVAGQTYRHIELIVVDGGLCASAAEAVARQLASHEFATQFVRRGGRTVPAALNEGIELARGTYVGVIERTGRYRRDLVEAFVRALAGHPARWGFSNVAFIDEQATPVRYGAWPRVDAVMRGFDALYACEAVGEAIIDRDVLVAAGNLFFEKSLWREAGAFPDLSQHWVWAFGLSALPHAEPVYFDEPACILEVPAIVEEDEADADQRRRILAGWERVTEAAESMENLTLRHLLQKRRRARDFAAMKDGLGHELNRSRMLRYAAELGFAAPPPPR